MVGNHDFRPSAGKDDSYTKTDKSNIRRVLNNISNSLVDEKDSNGTVSGMTCTSGLTNLGLELQQKFLRRRSRSKKQAKTKTRGDGLPEISEEYDIQTIVSGLTRNSEFPEYRDPPASVDHQLNNSSEWPDDETTGHQGHHVISIMDGNRVMSTDTIGAHQEKVFFHRHGDNSAPLPEPEDTRSKRSPKKEHPKEVGETVSQSSGKDPKPCRQNLLSPEPDGSRFRNGSKIAIEPSGMKIETLIYGCSMKNETHKNITSGKSRRKDPTVYMNDEDVEVVYQEKDPDVLEKIQGKFSRRRSRSTNAPKRTRNTRNPSKNFNEKGADPKPGSRSRSVDTKRRSRSLPRTLKRITSRYRKEKGEEFKRDPSPSKKAYRSMEPDDTDPYSIDPNFIDDIFNVIESRTVSTLGSQCRGIESPTKRKHMRNVPTNYSDHKFSPYSREEVFSSHPCEMKDEDSEPRVCVEFAPRQSGGYFNTTCYPDQKATIRTNFGKKSRHGNDDFFRDSDDASKFVPGFNAKTNQQFSSNASRDKAQRNMIAQEASKHLLLSPNGEDDSIFDNDKFFENQQPACSHLQLNVGNANFVRGGAKQGSVYETPAPEKELHQEFVGHKSSEYIDEPAMTHLSMTPSGRKEIIQRYLALREKHNKLEASFSSGQSVGSAYNTDGGNNIVQSSSVTKNNNIRPESGYDDASTYYQNSESEQWPYIDSFDREKNERISSYPEQMGKATRTQLYSESISRLQRSNSEGRKMSDRKENLFSLPNAYRRTTNNQESWRSPSTVSAFPSFQQEKLSYSYASDDDSNASNMFGGYKSSLNSPYALPAQSNYEEELRPHNQFMKEQIGLGNK